jgi:hypothetical protein
LLTSRLHAQTVFRAHEGAVHAMQLCQISSGSATPGPLCLVTSGDLAALNRHLAVAPSCVHTALDPVFHRASSILVLCSRLSLRSAVVLFSLLKSTFGDLPLCRR